MLTRQERKQFVIDLYNQGKTIRAIAIEARMSFRDIGGILKKESKEKLIDSKMLRQHSEKLILRQKMAAHYI